MDRSRIAILIPAYREAETIGRVVTGAARYGSVIVADDGSPDDTGERAAQAGAAVVRLDTNEGYDGALNRAFEAAAARGFEVAVTMDADGEHDPRLLAEFRRLLLEERVPLVLGVRARRPRLAERVMGVYIRWRFGAADILCGMKGYDLALWCENGGFDHSRSIGTELALFALRRGLPFRELPVKGDRRRDIPRFGRAFRANVRIFRALLRSLSHGFRRRQDGAVRANGALE